MPGVVAAAGLLDFPDRRAEIREALRGPGPGKDAAEIENLDAGKWTHASMVPGRRFRSPVTLDYETYDPAPNCIRTMVGPV